LSCFAGVQATFRAHRQGDRSTIVQCLAPLKAIRHGLKRAPGNAWTWHRYLWAALLSLALLLVPDSRLPFTRADDPQGKLAALRPPSQHGIRLTAGDNGPFFSLSDLAAYVPPPPKPPRWEIPPVVWQAYPALLDNVAVPMPTYAPETIRYLAGHEVRHGDRSKPYMALTFDCESGPVSTVHILNTLREQEAQATFFLLGKFAFLHPEIVRQMVDGGNELGNHSFFHPLFADIALPQVTQEITYTQAAVNWAVGQSLPMRYIRFPYGGRNDALRTHAATLGYQSVFWDIDPRGWEPDKGQQEVIDHVRRTAHAGGIVIMHCSSWDDAHALPGVIQAIREQGLSLGTLSDVLSAEDLEVPGYAPP
jgi:peptidoglycan/xylan/chitin deacetylase (PgdA/CDA1 family)